MITVVDGVGGESAVRPPSWCTGSARRSSSDAPGSCNGSSESDAGNRIKERAKVRVGTGLERHRAQEAEDVVLRLADLPCTPEILQKSDKSEVNPGQSERAPKSSVKPKPSRHLRRKKAFHVGEAFERSGGGQTHGGRQQHQAQRRPHLSASSLPFHPALKGPDSLLPIPTILPNVAPSQRQPPKRGTPLMPTRGCLSARK